MSFSKSFLRMLEEETGYTSAYFARALGWSRQRYSSARLRLHSDAERYPREVYGALLEASGLSCHRFLELLTASSIKEA